MKLQTAVIYALATIALITVKSEAKFGVALSWPPRVFWDEQDENAGNWGDVRATFGSPRIPPHTNPPRLRQSSVWEGNEQEDENWPTNRRLKSKPTGWRKHAANGLKIWDSFWQSPQGRYASPGMPGGQVEAIRKFRMEGFN